MTTELLEQRLRDLDVEMPDPERVTARVLSPAAARRARFSGRLPRVALGSIAALALVALVTYFVPAAGSVVAKVPLTGDVFGANDHITVVDSSSTSSGYTLTLVSAFADSTRTELRIHASPAVAFLGNDSTLTDQFGRSYHWSNGSSDLRTGNLVVDLEPLAWPDALTGARVTLSIGELDLGASPTSGVIRGSWRLSATLGLDEGTSLPVPASGSLGRAHFRFTSLSYTAETIAVTMDMTGASSEETSIDVVDLSGNVLGGRIEIDDDWFGVSHVHLLAYRAAGPGSYVVHVSYMGQSFERAFTVS